MKVRGDFLGPSLSTDKTNLIIKVRKTAKIRKRYNQVCHRRLRSAKIENTASHEILMNTHSVSI